MSIIFIITLIYRKYFMYRHFKIINATRNSWTLDSDASGLVTYRIHILTKRNSNELKLDELWIENRLFKVQVIHHEKKSRVTDFGQKEMLYIEAMGEAVVNQMEERTAPKKKKHITLGYLVNNKRKYLSVKNCEEYSSPFSIAR